jgi:hypothetical protein
MIRIRTGVSFGSGFESGSEMFISVPDPAKSFGSFRIGIRNTAVFFTFFTVQYRYLRYIGRHSDLTILGPLNHDLGCLVKLEFPCIRSRHQFEDRYIKNVESLPMNTVRYFSLCYKKSCKTMTFRTVLWQSCGVPSHRVTSSCSFSINFRLGYTA